MRRLSTLVLVAGVVLAVSLAGVHAQGSARGAIKQKGTIKADGSSTVYLITVAMGEAFKETHPGVSVNVGISGTGGGFKKFANGETDISNASRRIRETEAKDCKEKGVEYLELQVAWDGLSVVVNKDNDWANEMTMEELRKIWHPESAAKRWSDVRKGWPSAEIKLFGAGADSGTFDFFTEAVNGKEKVCRKDFEASEDDNVIVQGVAKNRYALGFFGMAYYEANKDKIHAVAIAPAKNPKNFVAANKETVLNASYPISRPLFIYVSKTAMQRPEVQEFVKFYLRRGDLVSTAKYVEMNAVQRLKEERKLQGFLTQLGSK